MHRSTSTSSGEKLVFCHFMVGIVSNRKSSADYDDDMIRAKDAGIDAFALNIGTDSYSDNQLEYAYTSAAKNGMKVFLSFDFNWWSTSEGSAVGTKIKKYASESAQLMVDGKVFVSSFSGDGVDVDAMVSSAGQELFFAPNFHPGEGNFDNVDAAFNWMGWPSNGNNKAPSAGKDISVIAGDTSYASALSGKPYIAPVSAWFSTHFGDEVSYSKNWVFPSDLLWYNRWREVLTLQPRFVEIITWNDYGESHYIGPLSSPHTDDGASKWVMDMPHGGWLEMAKPFISAYKAGSLDAGQYITEEKLVYWYRPSPRNTDCDATDTTMGAADNSSGNYFQGRPDGWETMNDEIFVVSLLKEPAQLLVKSGSHEKTFLAPAGIAAFSVPMGVGKQSFSVTRSGETVLSGTSMRDIVTSCQAGIYNFNAYVGVLPAPETIDELLPEGYASLTVGLKTKCPINTLSAVSGVPTAVAVPTTVSATASAIPNTISSASASASTSTDTGASIDVGASVGFSVGYTVGASAAATVAATAAATPSAIAVPSAKYSTNTGVSATKEHSSPASTIDDDSCGCHCF
ncbi:CAZyme family GH71 [Penicillium taxi]|uniref:CAZyme family GH71 n=1 Tax=Penicillium taxi TaxID=168475 RepID=UPI002545152F|nr:CAZyme family GH71 [Penicillium taxi]KAJ5888280.1 CAZyme family GH71 [Penicillium taxi]